MGRQAAIPRLGLQDEAIDCRARGLTLDETTARLNSLLKGGGVPEMVSRSAVARFLETVDQESTAVSHRQDLAERNVAVSSEVATRIRDTLAKLDALMPIAETDTPNGTPNWNAVLGVMREAREQIRLYADVTDRLHSAERVATFQRLVISAIDRASPEVAAGIRRELREAHMARRAELGYAPGTLPLPTSG